jgi:hypothetical protein
VLSFSELYDALNVAAITALVGTYESAPAIFNDSLIPQEYTGTAINFYLATPFDARIDWHLYAFTINCRASTYAESIDLADAVQEEINRKNYSGYYINCVVLPTISPADDTDDYNTIVEATLKKR